MKKEELAQIRQFNRFYTTQLNLMDHHHLGSTTTLLEGRIMLEISYGYRTVNQLVKILNLDKGYVSRTIKQLVGRQWLKSAVDPQDRRSKILTLTAQGRQVVDQVNKSSDEQVQTILAALSADELATVVRDMNEIQEIVNRYHPVDFGK
ncbi:MarR family winged helix-turn-helix transcriptional regulator [Limosilactobacillus kribbianus]|uniref:MarR family winged helix-turn-helix transcriptional regulator n=1 Tax=Limosilactobacillus kribbianus TaxID=2982695 RepID=UPI002264C0C8|nr:MarR family winged helix-turn-helix transcriptional regulator [Limosilactobacillus kribbianus]